MASGKPGEVLAHNNFQGHNDLRVHFGLGAALVIDSMRVFWPSGQVDVFSQLVVNQFFKLEEAGSLQLIPEQALDLVVKMGQKKGELQLSLPTGVLPGSLSLGNEQGLMIPVDFQVKGNSLLLTTKKKLDTGRYYLGIWGKDGLSMRGQFKLAD